MWPHDIFPDEISQRLALALLHFLWQGTLLAAVYSVAVEWFMRRPQRRYAAGAIALAAMAACLPITYWFVEPPPSKSSAAVERTAKARPIVIEDDVRTELFVMDSVETRVAELESPGQFGTLQAEVVAHGATRAELFARIVLVWLIGVVAFSLRLVGGAVGLRLLTRRTSPAPCEYVSLMERFGRAMRLGRLPRLVVSPRVSEAIASGFFRPVIVFPAAWLAELPPAVIEAVLAHELAHVRRYDLWVNLLQRAVEAVLFFHPAVWWISRQVRSDREMCCDEMAVTATGQKVAYVSALEVVARRAAREPLFSLAPGIGGRKMHLLERVRHVLGLPTQRQPGGWWAAGVLALAVPCGLWALTGPAAPRAIAQEERDEGDREREERDADREREEREDRDEREREVREESGERERDGREEREEREEVDENRPRALRERDEAERNEREARREFEIRRDREVRERAERPRREGDRPEARDPGRRASAEAQRQRAQQRANQAQQKQQQQARQQLERAREEIERRMSDARRRLGAQLNEAEAQGERDRVEALRREMEAVQRQAEDQVRALERQRDDLATRFRDADQERRAAMRNVAEQARMAAMQSRGEDERQLVREMAAMVKELRQEVQQLRREVRELREGAPRKDAPKKDPQPKGEASGILKTVPYVGKLFSDEKAPQKGDAKPKVALDFDGKKVEGGELKLELKLEGKELENLQRDLEKLQKVYADQIKSADIEFKKATDKLNDVKVEFKKGPAEKLKDIKVEFKTAPVKKLKDAVVERKEKVDVELKLDKSPAKEVKIELKKSPVEKRKDVEIEFKKAPVEKTKDAVLELKKSIADEVKKAELDVKKAIDKLKSEDLTVLKDRFARDVNVQYAAKAAEVAKMELEKALEATRKVPGAISDIDIAQMKQVQKRALHEIERAKQELLQQTVKLQDELKSKTLQDDLAKRLSELKRMVEVSTAKDKISKDKEPEKVIKKEEKVEIKSPAK